MAQIYVPWPFLSLQRYAILEDIASPLLSTGSTNHSLWGSSKSLTKESVGRYPPHSKPHYPACLPGYLQLQPDSYFLPAPIRFKHLINTNIQQPRQWGPEIYWHNWEIKNGNHYYPRWPYSSYLLNSRARCPLISYPKFFRAAAIRRSPASHLFWIEAVVS